MTISTLKQTRDFARLKSHGRRLRVNSWLLVNFQKNGLGVLRCGWTLPRQIRGAVVRNRMRRWGRDFLRRWSREVSASSELNDGLDLNLVFRNPVRLEDSHFKKMKHADFKSAMQQLVEKLESVY